MIRNQDQSLLLEKFNKFKSECRKKNFAKMISRKRIQNNIQHFQQPKKSLKEHTKNLQDFFTSFQYNQNDYSHNTQLCELLILLWNKLEANEEITDENNSKNLLIILLNYLSLKNISEYIKISLLDIINLLIIVEKNIIDSLKYNNNKKNNNFSVQNKSHFFNLTNIINNLLKKEIYFNNCLNIIGNMLLNDESKVPINTLIICLKSIGEYIRKTRNLILLNNIFWFLRIFFISQEKCDIYQLRKIVKDFDFLRVFNFLVNNLHFSESVLKMDSTFDTMVNFLWCFAFLINFSKIDVNKEIIRIPTDLYNSIKGKDFDIKFAIIFIQLFNLNPKFFEYFLDNSQNQNQNEEEFVNFLNYLITFNSQPLILEMIIFLDNYFFYFKRAESSILPLFKKLLINIFRNSYFSKQILHDRKLSFINKLISNYQNNYETLNFLEGLKDQTKLSIFSFKQN